MKFSTNDNSGLIKVILLLKSHSMEYLSGQDLSDVLKISRVAVWKHIKKIKELGYDIESKQKLGYRIKSITDSLLPWEVTSNLDTEQIGKSVYFFESTNSTQDQAKKIAAKNAKDGIVITTNMQTAGRGRNGRRWISPKGGIWFSVILRPKFDVSAVTLFPMAASLALSRAIKNTLGIKTELKWPNDITIRGKKVAGMLVDASLESNKIEELILGVGINFDIDVKSVKEQLADMPNFYGVASLAGNKKCRPVILVQAFLKELENVYFQMNHKKTNDIIKEWTELSSTIGRNVKVNTGDMIISGQATQIDHDGALVISYKNEIVRVMAGDVIHV
ncbi:MAG: biotin--[acetyl-CoA-carboxylase] ligase [Thaumarchaeota archaeon]|nr:biotin--[acetyl-CoA-carboxylase] ligase [Nitrososphaerota archaeon]